MRASKRIATGILSAILAMSMLAGCSGTANSGAASSGNNSSSGNNTSANTGADSGNNTNNSNSNATSEPENVLKTVTWANSKTNQYFKANGATSNKCYLDATLKTLGHDGTVKIAIDGNNLFIYSSESSPEVTWIYKGNKLSTLYADKTYYEHDISDDNDYQKIKLMAKSLVTFPTETTSSPTITTGKERLYGIIYDRETFRMDGKIYSYCYEGTELRYILYESQGNVMKVNKLTSTPDSNLFEIPENYTKAY